MSGNRQSRSPPLSDLSRLDSRAARSLGSGYSKRRMHAMKKSDVRPPSAKESSRSRILQQKARARARRESRRHPRSRERAILKGLSDDPVTDS